VGIITRKEKDMDNIEYRKLIISDALLIIAVKEGIERDKIEAWLDYNYGGTLEISIIDYFRNNYC